MHQVVANEQDGPVERQEARIYELLYSLKRRTEIHRDMTKIAPVESFSDYTLAVQRAFHLAVCDQAEALYRDVTEILAVMNLDEDMGER